MSRKEKKVAKQEAKAAKKEAKKNKKLDQVVNEPSNLEKPPKKRHRGRNILIVIVVLIIIIIIACVASSGGSDDTVESSVSEVEVTDEVAEQAAQYCESVKVGYLEGYSTVTIQEVLEAVCPDGVWNYGTTSDNEHYFVEFTDEDTIKVQFTVYDDEDEDFELTGYGIPSSDEDLTDSEVIEILHSYYWAYGTDNDCGIDVDAIDETDTSILIGHWGPVDEYVAEEDVESEDEDAEPTEDEATSEMTDEEIEAALAESYDIDIETMRERLYEGDLASYTEDEVAAMSNYECYVAYVVAAQEYENMYTGDEEVEAVYDYITTPDEYVTWFRTAEVGDTIDIDGVKIVSITANDSLYCALHQYGNGVNHDSAYFVVRMDDTSIYFMDDVVNMRVTYLGVNKGNVAVFECQTMGIQNY